MLAIHSALFIVFRFFTELYTKRKVTHQEVNTTTLEIVLRAFANRPGAFPIAGSYFGQRSGIERTNSNNKDAHGKDVENTSSYLEAEVILVVSCAIPVIVVDGVLENG